MSTGFSFFMDSAIKFVCFGWNNDSVLVFPHGTGYYYNIKPLL
ncbi:hypothetical protein CLOSTHATH_03915 [Hungatella hathewayi DSM 13479]|uniref:Uncharacterized protein n=1 Tax=Hungatella hathewayi DSM 13479 TaxID=566550 RepID=D3AJX2_9FIRM|nr:hypothetical protein CLOSTHATH_03915 [Hungatella hathewayi DSM 13479]